jgi:hypothetical protein
MRYFFEEQEQRLQQMGEECVAFEELVNEFNDMVAPAVVSRITARELRRSQLAYNVLSALTNARKYVAWEGLSCEKAAGRSSNFRGTTDWDLFADSQYRRLVEVDEESPDDES